MPGPLKINNVARKKENKSPQGGCLLNNFVMTNGVKHVFAPPKINKKLFPQTCTRSLWSVYPI